MSFPRKTRTALDADKAARSRSRSQSGKSRAFARTAIATAVCIVLALQGIAPDAFSFAELATTGSSSAIAHTDGGGNGGNGLPPSDAPEGDAAAGTTGSPTASPEKGSEGSNGASAASAVNGAAPTDDGIALAADGSTIVSSATELAEALANAPTDGTQTVIELRADQSGAFPVDSATFTVPSGANVVLTDAGTAVSISRNTSQSNAKPLFTVGDGQGSSGTLTVRSGTSATGSEAAIDGAAADSEAPAVTTDPSYNLSYRNQTGPFARALKGGTLAIEGGAFTGNVAPYGAVVQNGYQNSSTDNALGGTLTISGGLFEGNSTGGPYGEGDDGANDDANVKGGMYGGGVVFSSTDGTTGSTTISGGTFRHNWTNARNNAIDHEMHGGGAIHARRGGVTVLGGTFEQNKAGNLSEPGTNQIGGGGAIYVANAGIDELGMGSGTVPSKLTIASATDSSSDAPRFVGNISTGSGGAVMTAWNVEASFEAGTFEGNSAEDLGGGVYTEEKTSSEFGFTVAYGNTAAHFGGGLWLCPSGVSIASQASNLALFDNKAGGDDATLALDRYLTQHGTGGAGDDLAIMYPNKDIAKSNSTVISNSWYSGAEVTSWYEDGKSTVKATGFGDMGTNWGIGHLYQKDAFTVVADVPRYDGTQPAWVPGTYTLTQNRADVADWDKKGGIALKSIPKDEAAKQTAKSRAMLTFVNNTAGLSGGAIGSDGTLSFTSSGLASWNKVDADDPGTALGGSSWTLSYAGDADTPYADDSADNSLWAGDVDSPDRWSDASGTWTAIVRDNVGQPGYTGFDTDPHPGAISVDNLSSGTFHLKELDAPAGYAPSSKTYSFDIAHGSLTSLPAISGADFSGNRIGNKVLPGSAQLSATKHFSGGALEPQQFSFSLEERSADGSYRTLETVKNGAPADGSSRAAISFSAITYATPGEHVYRITETPGDSAGIQYDDAAYFAKVVVAKPDPSSMTTGLETTVTYYSDEACTQQIDPNDATFENVAVTGFSFKKVKGSASDGIALPGARFALFRLKDGHVDNATPFDPDHPGEAWERIGADAESDEDGTVAFSGLASGTYRLVETASPAGYVKPSGQWVLSVDTTRPAGTQVAVTGSVNGADGSKPPAFKEGSPTATGANGLSLPNYEGMTLPVSGSTGTWGSILVAALLFAGAAAVHILRKRGERR